jgi:hypothetical protein
MNYPQAPPNSQPLSVARRVADSASSTASSTITASAITSIASNREKYCSAKVPSIRMTTSRLVASRLMAPRPMNSRPMTSRATTSRMPSLISGYEISDTLARIHTVCVPALPPCMLCKTDGGHNDFVQSFVTKAGFLNDQYDPIDACEDASDVRGVEQNNRARK